MSIIFEKMGKMKKKNTINFRQNGIVLKTKRKSGCGVTGTMTTLKTFSFQSTIATQKLTKRAARQKKK